MADGLSQKYVFSSPLTSEALGRIVGMWTLSSTWNDKPFFIKDDAAEALCLFWSDGKEPLAKGWVIAPPHNLSEPVAFAESSDENNFPPQQGWCVPYNGDFALLDFQRLSLPKLEAPQDRT